MTAKNSPYCTKRAFILYATFVQKGWIHPTTGRERGNYSTFSPPALFGLHMYDTHTHVLPIVSASIFLVQASKSIRPRIFVTHFRNAERIIVEPSGWICSLFLSPASEAAFAAAASSIPAKKSSERDYVCKVGMSCQEQRGKKSDSYRRRPPKKSCRIWPRPADELVWNGNWQPGQRKRFTHDLGHKNRRQTAKKGTE